MALQLSRVFGDLLMYIFLSIGITPFSSSIHGHNIKIPFLLLGIIMLLRHRKMGMVIKHYFYKRSNQQRQTLIFFLALLGLFTGLDFMPVFLDYMAIAFFFFFHSISFENKTDYDKFKRFTMGLFMTISVLEFFVMYFGLSDVVTNSIRTISLNICPFFVSIVFLKEKRFLLSILFFSVLAYMTIRGAMRVNYIVVILYALYLVDTIFRRRDIKIWKKLLTVLVLASIIKIAFPIAKNYIESDASRNLHMVTRFTNMFDPEKNEEEIREETNKLIITHTADFIIPRGLGWQNHVKQIQSKYRSQYGVLSTMDSNLLYCVYHFGIFIGIYVMMIVILPCVRSIMKSIVNINKKDYMLTACFFTAILSMFVLKSWIFVYSSFGITYGILFAYTRGLEKYTFENED